MNKKCKTKKLIETQSLLLIFFITLAICACENSWMSEVLPKSEVLFKTVYFNSNGGTEVDSQILFKEGDRAKEPDPPPTKTGFCFAGWYVDNGTFNEPYDFDFVPLVDMTLHAKWIENFFKSVDELREFLNSQSTNAIGNPYYVKLNNISSFDLSQLKDVLNNAAGKYICLDLSNSGISTIPSMAFTAYTGTGISQEDNDPDHYNGCETLAGIILQGNVQSIEFGAFANCFNLTSITMNGVTSIGDGAFAWTGFKSVTIPASIENIGNNAFYGCDKLEYVTFESDNIVFLSETFPGDLFNKYYAVNPSNSGVKGTYKVTSYGANNNPTWTKQ